ncbi:MAG TPA: imidazole glycerol phosphate synthase subunit HisH [Flavisolibacter sp.]|nr:imidazole glycerol phosphate synthase subunit HisH [Flavisolibacter sp.]
MYPGVAIIDYGMGNLHSVYKKLSGLKVRAIMATTPAEVLKADKIILPGVGHFGKAMQNLKNLGIYDSLNEAVLVKKTPILGICLGMQLMANESEEGNEPGFGWINARVVKFRIQNQLKYKVPQTGWNSINICKESSLLTNIENQSEFYFLHSYCYEGTEPVDRLTTTEFEYEYVSAVQKDHIFGTQFHPEKSHQQGLQLLKNFIQI